MCAANLMFSCTALDSGQKIYKRSAKLIFYTNVTSASGNDLVTRPDQIPKCSIVHKVISLYQWTDNIVLMYPSCRSGDRDCFLTSYEVINLVTS